MECLDENSVTAFFERRLSAQAVEEVDRHVAGCKACRDLLAAFADLYPAARDSKRGGLALAPTAPDEQAPLAVSIWSGEVALGRHLALAAAERRVGTELAGRWILDRLVGVGGMGQVFAATHRNGKRAAVKLLRPELSVEPSIVRRFVREGYAANRVEHPGAVSVLDDGVAEDGSIFLVMDLLVGETLKARVERRGPLPVDEVLRHAGDVLDVLAAAHERGIVHRDIKPENLFVTEDGATRVLDFGIARVRELSRTQGSTESGVMMGTPSFMPPEQARGQSDRVDGRADLWAVGATMHVLLTARPLRQASSASEELFLAMTAPVASVALALPALAPAVAAIIDRALRFEPAERWPDARAMRAAVRDAAGRLRLPPRPRATKERGRLIVGILATGLLAVVGWVGLHPAARSPAPSQGNPRPMASPAALAAAPPPPPSSQPLPLVATTPSSSAPVVAAPPARRAAPVHASPARSAPELSDAAAPTVATGAADAGSPAGPQANPDFFDRRH